MFKVTLRGYTVEKVLEDGTIKPFSDQCQTVFHNLDRTQLKLLEEILLHGLISLHELGLKHPECNT